MKALTIVLMFAAASLSHAANIYWSESDASGNPIDNGSFVTVCGSLIAARSSCSEPSPLTLSGTHFSLTASASALNIDVLNTLLVATASVTSLDGTQGSVTITWLEEFLPYPGYFFHRSAPPSVVDSYTMTGGFAMTSPDAGDTIVAQKLQQTLSGSALFDPLTASAADGPSFTVGPVTQHYAADYGNGDLTTLSVTFNFLGATITAGDTEDIPVSSTSSSVPEPGSMVLMLGAAGMLAVRRWRGRA